MNGKQVVRAIEQNRKDSDQFIRWWRSENDFVDYELIDRFLETVKAEDEFAGFELLDT